MEHYHFKRELSGVNEQWHKIILPDEIFGKTTQNLSDIRVFGLTDKRDTIEVPYILNINGEKSIAKELAFKIINTSHTGSGYYFTFDIAETLLMNQINLSFQQRNFDWQVTLEGSHDLNRWFTVLKNYRILSIKNEFTDFQFTTLVFPESNYRFYRVLVNSKEMPELMEASLKMQEFTDGKYKNFLIKYITQTDHKQSRQSEIDIVLAAPSRISKIRFRTAENYDYYRPLTIKYLADSFKTEQGWKYNYKTLTTGILNSLDKNEFKFNSTTLDKLKIVIENQNNQALSVEVDEVSGYVHELLARFTQPATYFLVYGNKTAARPRYDVEYFTNQIPENLMPLLTGEELSIQELNASTKDQFLNKELLLWGIIILIILLLGWFTIRMMLKVDK
ncbi:MAG: DUF3999 family protein [Cyclobacteriaceae bacterium]|nr:DUF3999 family protein [Cyclobacteriaceae bacterium]